MTCDPTLTAPPDDTPCPFVRAPWLENPLSRYAPKPSAGEECFACGQRFWQHDAPARTEIARALLSLLVAGVLGALAMVVVG